VIALARNGALKEHPQNSSLEAAKMRMKTISWPSSPIKEESGCRIDMRQGWNVNEWDSRGIYDRKVRRDCYETLLG